MEEKATNSAGEQPPKYKDEFFTRRLGPDRFEVYRILGGEPGGQEVFYCECETLAHCLLIARALNSYHAAEFERNRRGSE